MNILSLFDGMSCGRLALERAGIPVTNYYSSEIDKFAILVADDNYPDNIKLGDVCLINTQMLPKIDLLIGGSPCQGFSFAGKQLNFNDQRSALFFEFVHKLKELKPTYFLLENVNMKQDYQDAISNILGCKPIRINSMVVSAQSRDRLYWTNIKNVKPPKDKNIYLADILQTTSGVGPRIVGRRIDKQGKRADNNKNIPTHQYLESRSDNKANCLTTVSKDSVVSHIKSAARRNRGVEIRKDSKANALLASGHQSRWLAKDKSLYRRLTVIECERLQTVPDNYTKAASNSQRYKMLGNGWTIDVIAHILKQLK